MGKSTISMAIFNSFLYVYQRVKLFGVVATQNSANLAGELGTKMKWQGFA